MVCVGTTSAPCEYVVAFHDSFINKSEGTVCMVVEYMDGGSLQDLLDAGGIQQEPVIASLSRQLLLVSCLSFVHTKCTWVQSVLSPHKCWKTGLGVFA